MLSFNQIRERKIVQWAFAYLASAWVALQVLSLLAEPFGWPRGVLRSATAVLAVTFIGVLVLAWYHGDRGRQRATAVELMLLFMVLITAGAAGWWVHDEPVPTAREAAAVESGERNSIAVLPFVDLSPARDHEYLSDGITEEIQNALARISALRVASRTSAFSFKGTNTKVDEIGRQLRVKHVLEGTVQKAGDRIRVSAQLIDAANGYRLWSQRYDRELKDVFALEDEISRAIASSLELVIVGADVAAPTENQLAHELYLRGRYAWASRTPDGLRRAVKYFEDAIAADSTYARAYQGLADALIVLPIYTDTRPAEAQPRAKEAALKAIALDSTLGEAQASLAYVKMSYERDWKGAGEGLRKALQLSPNYATANHWYGDWLAAQNRVDESISYYERAARLDPLSSTIGFSLGWLYMALGRFEAAVTQLSKTIEMDSSVIDAYTLLGRTRLYQGRHAEGIAALEDAVRRSDRSSRSLAFLGYGYGLANRPSDATRIVQELEQRAGNTYVSPLDFAFVHIALGNKDDAFRWLEKARAAGDPWLTENGFDPVFESLRSDPRWTRLQQSMGLSGQ